MDVPYKALSYQLYKLGKFGNKLKTWYSIDDFKKDNYKGSVTIRDGNKSDSPYYADNVIKVDEKVNEFISNGQEEKFIMLNESAPDDQLLIQGELMKDHRGYSFFYSLEKGKMRPCLKKGIQINGLNAKLLLQKYLYPSSLDDVLELLNEYPESVIEFSAYALTLGDCRNRNTVIWEVRNY